MELAGKFEELMKGGDVPTERNTSYECLLGILKVCVDSYMSPTENQLGKEIDSLMKCLSNKEDPVYKDLNVGMIQRMAAQSFITMVRKMKEDPNGQDQEQPQGG